MPNPIVGLAGASIGGSLLGAKAQSKAADRASSAQERAANLQVEEQRRQFNEIQKLLRPFVRAGGQGVNAAAELAGLRGGEAERVAVRDILQSQRYKAGVQQGEEAILANASATGGLRGGNTQAALAQFRPQMLSQLVGERYGQLQGLAGLGQASAAQQASAGQAMASNVGQAYGQMGAAQAGNALAQGQATQNAIGGITGGIGQAFGMSGGLTPPEGAGLFDSWGF